MKRALSILAAGAVLTSLTVGVASAAFTSTQPSDIQGYWAAPAIQNLMQRNIVGGYPDGSFRPSGTLTRAEFAVILTKALNLPSMATGMSSFGDVPAGHWAAPAIEAVRKAGLVGGYPDGTFHPYEPISRMGALAVLANVTPGQITDPAAIQQTLSQFSDGGSVPTWAAAAITETLKTGVYATDPIFVGQLQPNRPVTRGEVAAMTSNLLSRLGAQSNIAANDASSTYGGGTYTSSSITTTTTTQQPLQGRVAIVPAQTQFATTLTTALDSETAKVGDSVRATLDMPIASSDNMIVVPSGSQLLGQIISVEPTGRLEKNATLSIRFTEVMTPQGERLPIQASIATTDGLLVGGSAKGRLGTVAVKTAGGAALGAALGTAMGPLSGGSVGKGAIYGTAIGGGLGALAAGVSKGNPVLLQAGEKLQIRLDQALQTTVQTNSQMAVPMGY